MITEERLESITIESIVAIFKSNSDKKKIREIKNAIVQQFIPNGEQIEIFEIQRIEKDKALIEKRVEQIIKEDQRLGNESLLKKDTNGYYRKRPNKLPPPDTQGDSRYIGTAGEMAVISELMFNGYNANRMMIDEGIDIVASKNNKYTYIQVKTTNVKDGRVSCQINDNRFEQYIGSDLRYIVVARYNDKGVNRNMFFVFTQHDIDKGVHDRYIKRGEEKISIKIKFHDRSGEPILYDEKENNASYHLNNFSLI